MGLKWLRVQATANSPPESQATAGREGVPSASMPATVSAAPMAAPEGSCSRTRTSLPAACHQATATRAASGAAATAARLVCRAAVSPEGMAGPPAPPASITRSSGPGIAEVCHTTARLVPSRAIEGLSSVRPARNSLTAMLATGAPDALTTRLAMLLPVVAPLVVLAWADQTTWNPPPGRPTTSAPSCQAVSEPAATPISMLSGLPCAS